MSLSLADQYYLKAMDEYPYSIELAMENLLYSLGYDEDHARAHCLMARLCHEQLKDFDKATHHFESALAVDLTYVSSYYYYSDLLIELGHLDRAEKLLKFASNQLGISKSVIFSKKALIAEKKMEFKKAKKMFSKAIKYSICNECRSFFTENKNRVKEKIKSGVKGKGVVKKERENS